MSSNVVKLDGAWIRKRLRDAKLPGGTEKVCCGGRITFNRDYATQLRTLKMRGTFKIFEKEVYADTVTV